QAAPAGTSALPATTPDPLFPGRDRSFPFPRTSLLPRQPAASFRATPHVRAAPPKDGTRLIGYSTHNLLLILLSYRRSVSDVEGTLEANDTSAPRLGRRRGAAWPPAGNPGGSPDALDGRAAAGPGAARVCEAGAAFDGAGARSGQPGRLHPGQ